LFSISLCFYFYLDIVVKFFPPKSGGVVYVVKHISTKENFIIKTTKIFTSNEKQNLEEVIAEWKRALKISKNIVEYIDHWYDKGYIHIVMEYCAGGDLGEEIEKKIKNNKKFSEEVFFIYS
jgi:serine/threonine protein kinase